MANDAIKAMRRATMAQQTRTLSRSGKIPVAEPVEMPQKDDADFSGPPNVPHKSDSQLFSTPAAKTADGDAIEAMRKAVSSQLSRSGKIPIAVPEKKAEPPNPTITTFESEPLPGLSSGKKKLAGSLASSSKTLLNTDASPVIDEQEVEPEITPRPNRTGLTTVDEYENAIKEQQQLNEEQARDVETLAREARNAEMEAQIHEENCELLKDQVAAAMERSGMGRITRKIAQLDKQIKAAELEKKRIVDEAQRQFKQIKEDAERAVRTGVGKATGQFKVRIQDDAAEIPQQVKETKRQMDEIRSLMTQRIRQIAAKVDENESIRNQVRKLEEDLSLAASKRQAADARVIDLERRIELNRLTNENQQAEDAVSMLRLEIAEMLQEATDIRNQLQTSTDDELPPIPEPQAADFEPAATSAQTRPTPFDLEDFELDIDISLDLDDLDGSKGGA